MENKRKSKKKIIKKKKKAPKFQNQTYVYQRGNMAVGGINYGVGTGIYIHYYIWNRRG